MNSARTNNIMCYIHLYSLYSVISFILCSMIGHFCMLFLFSIVLRVLLRYLTYALNHCNPIVKKFSDIALRCALSPMGANIALLRYLYDVSFDRKLHVNEQSICNFYKIHSDSEKYATVGVLRDLINCRDGIHVIDYYNYDDITGIIDELCTN